MNTAKHENPNYPNGHELVIQFMEVRAIGG